MSFVVPEADSPDVPELEPGSPGNPLELTDPRALRALTRSARIAIARHLALRLDRQERPPRSRRVQVIANFTPGFPPGQRGPNRPNPGGLAATDTPSGQH